MGVYRKPNSPYYHYSFKLPGRLQKRGSTHQTDQKLAEAFYHKIRTEAYANKHFNKAARITVRELLEWTNRNHWNYKKWQWNLQAVLDRFAKTYAADLGVQELLTYVRERAKIVSPSTVNKEITLLSAAFNYAIKAKTLFENPAKEINKFDCGDRNREKFLTPQEKVTLVNAAEGILQDLIVFALQTGMRRGEILALKWDDVDMALKQMRVVSHKGSRVIVRRVPIFDRVEEILRSQTRIGPYVFHYADGRPLSPNGVVKSCYKRLIEKTGVQGGDFTFHDLRHTFASDFLMAGNSLAELQTILGHRRHDTTRRYAHLSREHLKLNMAKLPRLVYDRKEEIGYGNALEVLKAEIPFSPLVAQLESGNHGNAENS